MKDSHPDYFKGWFKIKFSTVLADHGWDLAYDLDAHMKTLDRPNIPRLVPHIRFTNEGHPATSIENDRRQPKTLASLYCPNYGVIKAIYDPNYETVDYRYRLVNLADPEGDRRGEEDDCSTYGSLGALLKAFCKDWVENHHLDCMDHYEAYRKPGNKHIPEAYIAGGYGLFG